MITFCRYGAMYGQKEEGDIIHREPIRLGDGVIHPGEFVQRLGEIKRTSFEMKDGYYLRYVGWVEDGKGKTLLFTVNDLPEDDLFYAFAYISPNTLLLGDRNGCWDVRIRKLRKVKNPAFAERQMELFEFVEEA